MKNAGIYGGSLENANPNLGDVAATMCNGGLSESLALEQKRTTRVGRELVEHAAQLLGFPIINLPGACTVMPIESRYFVRFLVRQKESDLVDEYVAAFTDDRKAIEFIKLGI